jgi:CheY-like chemotaxis protein
MEKNIAAVELEPGMRLSKPVYVEGTHIVLINKDVILDASNINILKQLGISGAFIYEDGRPSAATEKPEAACGVEPVSKILVVDDEAEICHYIKDVLENSGYRVVCANSADEAWEKIINDGLIDTLFLDLMMPGVGGLDLLKRIRAEIKRNINVVIVTAKKSMQDVIMAKELGISGYLTKPFDPQKLVVIANQASCDNKTI